MKTAVALACLLWAAAALPAETYMLLVEQRLDGQEDPAAPAGLQGLMSGMFDRGQVTFDSGPYRPAADWDRLEFRESLNLAREGLAHYLATVRFEASSTPADAGEAPAYAVRVAFQLWSAHDGSMLGEGELSADNLGREGELPYEALLFKAGESAAAELEAIAARSRRPQ